MTSKRLIHFICNGVYSDKIGGGDVHMLHLARAALQHGYDVNFFGGHALKRQLEKTLSGHTIVLTDSQPPVAPFKDSTLAGQLRMFRDYLGRLRSTYQQLSTIQGGDLAYATGDYWYDVLPLIKCRARAKMMIYHMEAPSFSQIALRKRADVDAIRLASLHYWASQNWMLRRFRRCTPKRLLYVHPAMHAQLLKRGYAAREIRYVSFGVDSNPANSSGPKLYDVVWVGRKHRQKGIEDLLHALAFLNGRIQQFRAVLIGRLRDDLASDIERLGLAKSVELAGFVDEEEKFRLFNASRLFLMPSRFEGSPRAVAEALVCRVPVLAYELPTYRPLFHEFVKYVPAFDLRAFCQEAEKQVCKLRAGDNYLDDLDLQQFRRENSWQTVENTFCQTLDELNREEQRT